MKRYDQDKVHSVFGGAGFYIALAVCLVAAGVIGYFTILQPNQKEQNVASHEQVEEVKEPTTAQAKPEVHPQETKPVEKTVEAEDLLPQVISPLDGTTVTVFSMTELMYDETMADWRTHNGVDIQASEGDAVKTAADGTVSAVWNDELMGVSVIVEHADGYSTQYSSLQENPPVSEGQKVSAGDIVGYVGTTAAAEGTMGAHLHFSVFKDGEIIDPSEYIKK